MSGDFLAVLANEALRIEKYMKKAQDIEWALDAKGDLYILQTRPLQIRKNSIRVTRNLTEAIQKHRGLLAKKGTITCRGIASGRVAREIKGQDTHAEVPE